MISAVAAQNPSLQKNYNYNTYYSQPLQTTKEKIIYIYIQDSFLCQLKRKSNKMEKNDNKVKKNTHCNYVWEFLSHRYWFWYS